MDAIGGLQSGFDNSNSPLKYQCRRPGVQRKFLRNSRRIGLQDFGGLRVARKQWGFLIAGNPDELPGLAIVCNQTIGPGGFSGKWKSGNGVEAAAGHDRALADGKFQLIDLLAGLIRDIVDPPIASFERKKISVILTLWSSKIRLRRSFILASLT